MSLLVICFLWIWALPLLIMGCFFMIPICIFLLPATIVITWSLQWWHGDHIVVHSFVRNLFTYFNSQHPAKNPTHPTHPTIYAAYPHGILSLGPLVNLHFVPNSNTVFCIAPLLFYIPILGWCLQWCGFIPATEYWISKALKEKYTLIIVPGGVPEMCLPKNQVFLKKRWGIFRIAKKFDTPIIPCFSPEEHDTFAQFKLPFLKQRTWLAWKTNIPCIIPYSIVPRTLNVPITLSVQIETSTTITVMKEQYIQILRTQHFTIH